MQGREGLVLYFNQNTDNVTKIKLMTENYHLFMRDYSFKFQQTIQGILVYC